MLGGNKPFTMVPFFWTKHSISQSAMSDMRRNGTRLVSRGISHNEMASFASAAMAAISPSLLSNATKNRFALSWRWKANARA